MRCDVNISVNDEAAGIWGERVEIKNLSSLRAIERAIGYEIRRQTALCEANEPVLRETRGFDVVQGKTVLLRSKEQMLDYRFMAEPDLPPLRVSESHIEEIRQHMPELPEAVRARFLRDYQLSRYDCDVIIHTPHAINFYDAIVDFQTDNTDTKTTAQRDPKVCANWLTTELFGRLKAEDGTVTPLAEATATAADLAVIVDRVAAGRISGNVGKKLLDLLLAREQDTAPVSVDELIAQNDWLMITDDAQLTELCKGILADFPDEIAEYRATGNKRKVAILIGHAMKLSKGKANPQFVSKKMFQLAK
jgi:aspartyl-tRNA(Asn)/glutamyl-tRNA(Gln) amidotransferase subunit B